MSWNNIPNDERLRLWKTLRTDISGLPLDAQMNMVAKFFASMPYTTRTLDYYTPSAWPTPWEILFRSDVCKSAISLLIFYTFSLISSDHTIELHLIDDATDMYLVPVIDDQFVLNYELGVISNYLDVSDEYKISKKFTKEQIKQIA